MVLDALLLNTQQYKLRIKGKVEQSRESPPLHLRVVAIEKGAFESPSTTVDNFTFLPLSRGALSVFFNPSRLGQKSIKSQAVLPCHQNKNLNYFKEELPGTNF